MIRQPGERHPPPERWGYVPWWEDIWQKIVGKMGSGEKRKPVKTGRVTWIVIGIAVLIWLAPGIYVVGPGEVGVVRQFGRFVAQTGPGLNYRLPWPIQAHDIVNVAAVRRAEIGYREVEERGTEPVRQRMPEESLMVTGDRNIVDIQILVLYQVKDAVTFLFRAENPEEALRVNTEVALRSVIGNMDIDHAMTVGRPEVEVGTWKILQMLLDAHQTGLHVAGVELQEVDPPDEVSEAFYDVVRAKADKERLIRESEGYARDVVPRARGEAAAIVHAATAYRDARIALAEGEAERFLKILEEYRKAEAVTRQRLYLETIERVLAGTKKFIIDPQVGGKVMQFLPLTELPGLEKLQEAEE